MKDLINKITESTREMFITESDSYTRLKEEYQAMLTNSLASYIIRWIDDSDMFTISNNDIEGIHLNEYFDGDAEVQLADNYGRLNLMLKYDNLLEWVDESEIPQELFNFIDEAESQINEVVGFVLKDNLGCMIADMISNNLPTFADWDSVTVDKSGNAFAKLDDGSIAIL